ncbi:MAG: diaminopimelate epimerase [Lysobacterales bacterium]|jgi:diaminopimelate epimerase
MSLEFHKMHGAGNDFVLIDARGTDFTLDAQLAGRIADRHLGVGCDQILVLRTPRDPAHRVRYEIRNADGSPAGQCGNGARCIALYLQRQGDDDRSAYTVESPAGVVTMRPCADGEFEVDMGVPRFSAEQVPLDPARARRYPDARNGPYRLDSPWGPLEFGAVSMGNPHALFTVEDLSAPDIPAIGAFVGAHEAFPEGCNVGFALIESPERIRLRVIERGAGETLACGSGACAAVTVLSREGRLAPAVEVFLPGGCLVIKWRGIGEPVTMKGPAEYVFRGTMNE